MLSLKLGLYIALCGFITSLTIHVCVLLGMDLFPSGLVSILVIGLFLTIVPASLLAGLEDKSVTVTEHGNRIRRVLAACPPAMRYGTIVFFLYGIANMIKGIDISFGTSQETPDPIRHIRSFSAVLTAFYAVAGMLWYSIIHSKERATSHASETKVERTENSGNQ